MADRLETYIAKLPRREDTLRGALKIVLDALREQRAYTDSLYDQMYSMAERIEQMEDMGGTFPADEGVKLQECGGLQTVCIQDSGDKQSAVEKSEDLSSLSGCGDSSSPVHVGKAPELPVVAEQPAAPAAADLNITGHPEGEQVGHYTIEEFIESILAESSKRADDRFPSIKRNDREQKKKLRQLLSWQKRPNYLAK